PTFALSRKNPTMRSPLMALISVLTAPGTSYVSNVANAARAPRAARRRMVVHSSVRSDPSIGFSFSSRRRLLEFLFAVGHLGFESGEDARVHLADARFGEVQCRADFFHRHLFEVVEDDDEALRAGQALGDQLFEVLALDFADRVGAALVFQHVDL